MTTADLLRRATQALDGHQYAQALELALTAWREQRAPELADAVEALAARLGQRLPAIGGRTRVAFHDAWLDVALQRRPVDVARLLDGLRHPPWKLFRDRLERLERFGDDPRISAALAAFVRELPTMYTPGTASWTLLFTLLARAADVRQLAVLEAALAHAPTGLFREQHLRPGIERTLAATRAAPAAPLDVEALRALEALAAARARVVAPAPEALGGAVPAADDAGVLAAVYADPDDDSARLVYADWLMERGDARGELIRLQLAPGGVGPAQKKRERALLRQHGREWLGAIEPLVARGSYEWGRGFLASAAVPHRLTEAQRALCNHPAWSTVRVLRGWSWDSDPRFFVDCELRGMHELRGGVPLSSLAQMLVRPRPYTRLSTLQIGLTDYRGQSSLGSASRRDLLDGEAMPALRRVAIYGFGSEPVEWQWLLAARFMAGVEELELNAVPSERCDEAQLAAHPSLQRVELNTHTGVRHWLRPAR